MTRSFISLFFWSFVCSTTVLTAQDQLPTIYKLGEEEAALEQVQAQYPHTLLDACEGNMGKAFELWISFLKELEAYARECDYQLDGSSLWLQVFFSENGRIVHLGYYPKPNSRSIDDEKFKQCLEKFVATYHLPLDTDKPYYNYTDVKFPLIYELYERQ